jgi:hypothetical protein
MHRTQLVFAFALVVAPASVFAGCSDDDDDASLTTASSGAGASTSASTAASAGGAAASGGTGAGAGGGTATGGTGGAGGGATGGTGGGAACVWNGEEDTCGPGSYCDAVGCGAGTCVPVADIGDEQPDKAPVCGCDGATYWNASVAASHGTPVSSAGECPAPEFCGGFGNLPCPATLAGRLSCNYGGNDASVCLISDQGGACWGMPAKCPSIVIGATTRACGAASCDDECELIKQGVTFYPDLSCPQ